MRLGFGKNSGKFYVAIDSNHIAGSSYIRWLHNTLFSENSHGYIVIVIAYTQTHVVTIVYVLVLVHTQEGSLGA